MESGPIAGRVICLLVSLPKTVTFNGRDVNTSIFKTPVTGKVKLTKLNLAGDAQADLTVHGGPDKALYTYPVEHYPWWQEQMPDVDFSYGKFGENLTTEGLLERDICIGDEFKVGTAVIKVSQPRLPCYKLGVKFGRNDVIKRFMQSGYSGIYFSVVQEGELMAGDSIEFLRGDGLNIKVQKVANLFTGRQKRDPEFVKRALESQLADQMKMFIGIEVSKFKELAQHPKDED
ncbi:MAG: MOSC domain-containing protein [Candidatus Melainabacteria bacterium]|nr:MAG: MOSC domain-containing protein [Candidatus Melainabacteria bacterium]